MSDFLVLLVHLLVTAARLVKPGGLRSVVVESVLLRHQLDSLPPIHNVKVAVV